MMRFRNLLVCIIVALHTDAINTVTV